MVDVAQLAVQVDTTDLKDAKAEMDKFTASGKRAQAQTSKLTAATANASVAARRGRTDWRQIGLQLNQVSQQTAATGNALQALAIQLPDILLGFGSIGVAAGIAAPAIVGLASSMFGASEDAKSLEESLDNLRGITERQSASVKQLTTEYGELALAMRDTLDAQAAIAAADAADSFADSLQNIGRAAGAYTNLEGWTFAVADMQLAMGLTEGQALELGQALVDIVNAPTPTEQIDAMSLLSSQIEEQYGTYSDMPSAIQDFYRELQTAIDLGAQFVNVGNEAAQAWSRAFGASGIQGGRGSVVPNATDILMMGMGGERITYPTSGGTRSGGGGGVDQFATRLERLQQQLMTEREIVDEWYSESQEILADRRAQELLGEEAHKEALLDLEREYQERLANVQETQTSRSLTLYGGLFGSMAALAKEGGEKTFKIWKAFSIAQATIDSYRAYTQVLADPFFIGRPWMRAIAAGSVLASGLAQVAAISSASIGGGTSSGGGAAASVPSSSAASTDTERARPTNVAIQLTGGPYFDRSQIRELINQINEAVDDGAKIRIV